MKTTFDLGKKKEGEVVTGVVGRFNTQQHSGRKKLRQKENSPFNGGKKTREMVVPLCGGKGGAPVRGGTSKHWYKGKDVKVVR